MATHLPANERILVRTRPGVPFVLLYRQGWWLVPPLLLLLFRSAVAKILSPDSKIVTTLPMLALGWLLAGLCFRTIAWLCRSYTLTARRLFVAKGILSRAYAEVPLVRIQHATLTQSFLERIFGLGTIGISTADGNAINWLMTPDPHAVLTAIRNAAEQATALARAPVATRASPPPPVIGLAGGIGSGKSEVARILASLGCAVIDSDTQAKQALDRPEVRDQLVRWWGSTILEPSGKVNRKAVADIIFKDAAQRARLESLVHPIVRARRADARAKAVAAGAAAVVIDAPLLFEAGVDVECDTIIFIDAPREVRLSRVRETRRWDDAELSRREQSQLPLDEKRRRSDHIIVNSGDTRSLTAKVKETLARIVAPPTVSTDM